MKKINDQICMGLLNNCPVGRTAEKSVTKKETKTNEINASSIDKKSQQKPWSVFGDLYWI